jgi:hypothetical protein
LSCSYQSRLLVSISHMLAPKYAGMHKGGLPLEMYIYSRHNDGLMSSVYASTF